MVQNAPEKILPPPSPTLTVPMKPPCGCPQPDLPGRCSSQVVANIESSPREPLPPHSGETSIQIKPPYSSNSTDKPEPSTDLATPGYDQFSNGGEPPSNRFDALELNIQEMLALDIENSARKTAKGTTSASVMSLSIQPQTSPPPTGCTRAARGVFKSLPNLSSSSENLLP